MNTCVCLEQDSAATCDSVSNFVHAYKLHLPAVHELPAVLELPACPVQHVADLIVC